MGRTCGHRKHKLQGFVSSHPGRKAQSGEKDPEQMWGKNPQILMRGKQRKRGEGENSEGGDVEEDRVETF